MKPSLGPKKKENLSKMDRRAEDLPQLSNEMQLSIMNKVKSGELSIEDALKLAREDKKELHLQKSQAEEGQYNFSVHKHSHYRWQKRVLQIDFKTEQLCSIEKGIVKRQLPFSIVRSCDDGPGSKFSISFRGHHDYELEATSEEDKQKMLQLLNRIIYRNIYSATEGGDVETNQQPEPPQSIREGILFLHRGGLASLRWVKYEVKLHPGELVLVSLKRGRTPDAEAAPAAATPTVIHLSDGYTSVQKLPNPDCFTLVTHKNEYQFRVPVPDQASPSGTLRHERDAWVEAIDTLCSEWRRKSMNEDGLVERTSPRDSSVTEELERNGGLGDGNAGAVLRPVDEESADHAPGGGDCPSQGDTCPAQPVPQRRSGKAAGPPVPPRQPAAVSPSSFPIQPFQVASLPSAPETEPAPPVVKVPPPPDLPAHLVPCRLPPAPPPLPRKLRPNSKIARTKAFHWDVVGPEKFEKSFWSHDGRKAIEIDSSRLLRQFAVKNLAASGAAEPSQVQHIMLNEKIAHNFNIFLKSFPVQPGELKDKLFVVNEGDGGLSDEHITSLRRYIPTLEDIEMYKSHKGPVAELHIVDQYMMEMCDIPGLGPQLDLLLTLRELPVTMSDLRPLIDQKIRMCTQLSSSRSFVRVLEYLLAVGNYLNENARKEKARGVRLSSLAKLSQLRGSDRKFTLLHALVEQIVLQEPCLASFTQELAEFETVPGASIKGLTAELDVLKNELEKVIQYTKKSKKGISAGHPKFYKDLKTEIERYKEDLSVLMKTCEEMKKLYSAILVKFGEPADQDSRDLFGLISQFVHDFKRAHADAM